MSSADDWLRQAQEESEHRFEEVADLRAAVATAKGRARSADGLVSVVVAPGGALVSLELDERVMAGTALSLQTAIVDTIRRASAQAAYELERAIRPIVGDRYDEAIKAAQSEMPDLPELDRSDVSTEDRADDEDLSQDNVFGDGDRR